MSEWTHSICELCWNQRTANRQPMKVREEFRDEEAEVCCFCGRQHGSGIYVRDDPRDLLCKGNHTL